MRSAAIAIILLASLAPEQAFAQAEAYARHWPLQEKEVGVYAVTLTPELYAQIQRADLGDLAAFNAQGEALAFGPLAPVWQAPEPTWRSARWFALPASAEGAGEALSVQVDKATDGSIRLRADVAGGEASMRSGEMLVDTGLTPSDNQRLLALAFDFDAAAADFSAQIGIDVSDDLEDWRVGVASASVLRLQQAGQRLLRRQIELPGISGRYLRLRRLDAALPLPLAGVQVQTRDASVPPPQPSVVQMAELVSRDGRTLVYRLPARIPIEQVNLRLAQDNVIAEAALASREGGRGAWRPRGSLTAFRLRAAGVELDNEALWLGGSRDREWRVELQGELAEAPVLEFSYRPERWLLLTQGEAPYVIAAGSARAIRAEMPLAALLAPIRSKYGSDWQPPEASLGASVVVAGDAAIAATAEERWSGHLLWALLLGSALAIGVMVVRLLRHPPSAS